MIIRKGGEGVFRSMISSRLIQAGIAFFVLVVGGSLLYAWHLRRTTDAEFATPDKRQQRAEEPQDVRSPEPVLETDAVESEPAAIEVVPDDKEALPADAVSEVADPADVGSPEAEAIAVDGDVPVSPYGFGPYPEVPDDYFGEPIWVWDPNPHNDFVDEARMNIELIDRVLVKLWWEGDRAIVGGSTFEDRVYPLYADIVYVKWKEGKLPDGGTYRYPGFQLTGAADEEFSDEDFMENNYPPHVKLVDIYEAGYDPYEFLNLEDNRD